MAERMDGWIYERAESSGANYYDNEMMGEVMSEAKSYVTDDPAQSSAKAKEHQYQLDNVTLNIAITGESGVGKSSFVNAMRGLGNGDYGAAETGVTETTLKAVRYSHPTMPNVYIWDLPGIGTPNFKAKKYLKEVQFDSYDFFIIIGAIRFKQNDMMLAKEIKKQKKTFYFVRSKVDQDVHAEIRKKNVTEEEILTKIRLNCRENLASVGNPKVFLISTMDLGKYDFQKLVDNLKDNLPEHKWSALVESLPVCSLSMIETKKKDLKKRAALAAAAAATSVHFFLFPGLSVACEIVIMVEFLQRALISFGLDEKSIQALAVRVNTQHHQLKSVMKSRFSDGVDMTVVSNMFRTTGMIAAKTVEAVLFLFPAITMGIAFGTTLQLLYQAIKEMSEDSKAVIIAAGLCTSQG